MYSGSRNKMVKWKELIKRIQRPMSSLEFCVYSDQGYRIFIGKRMGFEGV